MELVTSWEQIVGNIAELERVRALGRGPQYRDYLSLIQLGTIFLPYETESGLSFAPSRFLGYIENTIPLHTANTAKDGRETTPAISRALNKQPEVSDDLDGKYKVFCNRLTIEARATGNFGAPRRFWVL